MNDSQEAWALSEVAKPRRHWKYLLKTRMKMKFIADCEWQETKNSNSIKDAKGSKDSKDFKDAKDS